MHSHHVSSPAQPPVAYMVHTMLLYSRPPSRRPPLNGIFAQRRSLCLTCRACKLLLVLSRVRHFQHLRTRLNTPLLSQQTSMFNDRTLPAVTQPRKKMAVVVVDGNRRATIPPYRNMTRNLCPIHPYAYTIISFPMRCISQCRMTSSCVAEKEDRQIRYQLSRHRDDVARESGSSQTQRTLLPRWTPPYVSVRISMITSVRSPYEAVDYWEMRFSFLSSNLRRPWRFDRQPDRGALRGGVVVDAFDALHLSKRHPPRALIHLTSSKTFRIADRIDTSMNSICY